MGAEGVAEVVLRGGRRRVEGSWGMEGWRGWEIWDGEHVDVSRERGPFGDSTFAFVFGFVSVGGGSGREGRSGSSDAAARSNEAEPDEGRRVTAVSGTNCSGEGVAG